MFKKNKTKSNYYFDSFPLLADFSVKCAEAILKFMRGFDMGKLEELKDHVHSFEHQADNLKHEVTAKLMSEFMTPIDREDIFELLRLIDDVTDAIEEVSLKLYIYNYEFLPRDTIPMTELTLECIKKMKACLEQFPHYLNKEIFEPYVNEVIKLEEESDEQYIKNMRYLYLNERDGFVRHKSEAMYKMLEEVSDRCREVCRFVQNIALKNI